MSMYTNVPKPPLFIIHNSTGFNRWAEWARDFKEENYKGIQPFGVQFDIEKGIDGFMSYYSNMRKR